MELCKKPRKLLNERTNERTKCAKDVIDREGLCRLRSQKEVV